jgi:hypothetical protein
MARLLRKLAQIAGTDLITSAWRDVSDSALQRGGARLYDAPLIPGFDETRADRILMLPSREAYNAQIARGESPRYESDLGEAKDDVTAAKRGIRMLSKISASLLSMDGEDGDFRGYSVDDYNTFARDYSAQRERDNQTGIDLAFSSNEAIDAGSSTPSVSGRNPVLGSGPRESKEAWVKRALQSASSTEEVSDYPSNAAPHAEITDPQQSRRIGEAHDALQFYAPMSPEGGTAGPVFEWSAQSKMSSADFTPDTPIDEDDEARGLSQWPHVLNDSRQAGQGDEPTSTAWGQHDSFNSATHPSVDSSGNPGPST